MLMLTKSMQEDISRQMPLKSRDIDVCLMGALDETLPKEYILDCLMMYQNKDGGFAGGLNIDNYNTNSSILVCLDALQMLDITGFDKKSCEELYKPILDKLGNYLFNRCETKDNKWNGNTLTNNDFAHAKIYTFNDENKLLLGYHPTAAIVGYILHLLPETKAYYKKAYLMAERIINDVLNSNNITLYELKSFNIFLAKIKEENLFSDKIKEFENKLINYAKEMITIDFEDFSKAHPLDCYSLDDKDIKDMIDRQLDYIISNIAPHGLWDHKESWGYNTYVEEESAMIKWIGHETVLNYYFLKKFNRIEK